MFNFLNSSAQSKIDPDNLDMFLIRSLMGSSPEVISGEDMSQESEIEPDSDIQDLLDLIDGLDPEQIRILRQKLGQATSGQGGVTR